MTSNIRGSSICFPKSLYKKTSQEILADLKAAFKTGESKVPRLRPVLPSLQWQAYVNSQLPPTTPSLPRGRDNKNVTKMNFSSYSDHSPKWIINDCYIFFHSRGVNRDIGPAVRVFANGPGDLGSIPGRVIPKTLKMLLDTTLLNTQHYKVRIKGKVEQSWEWSSALPYTLV